MDYPGVLLFTLPSLV